MTGTEFLAPDQLRLVDAFWDAYDGLLNPDTFELAPADAVRCGNRKDLPKKQRRHPYLSAGRDVRHQFTGFDVECEVRICPRCGADKAVPVVLFEGDNGGDNTSGTEGVAGRHSLAF